MFDSNFGKRASSQGNQSVRTKKRNVFARAYQIGNHTEGQNLITDSLFGPDQNIFSVETFARPNPVGEYVVTGVRIWSL